MAVTTVPTATAMDAVRGIQPLIQKVADVFEAVSSAVDSDKTLLVFMALYRSFKPLVKWLDRDYMFDGPMRRAVLVCDYKVESVEGVLLLYYTRDNIELWHDKENGRRKCVGTDGTAGTLFIQHNSHNLSLITNRLGILVSTARETLLERAQKLDQRNVRLTRVHELLSEATAEATRLDNQSQPPTKPMH